MADVAAEDEIGADIDGDALLDSVHTFLCAVCFLSVAACIRRSHAVDCAHPYDGHMGQHAAHCLHVAGARIRQNASARGDRVSRPAPGCTRSTIASPTSSERLLTRPAGLPSFRTRSTRSLETRPRQGRSSCGAQRRTQKGRDVRALRYWHRAGQDGGAPGLLRTCPCRPEGSARTPSARGPSSLRCGVGRPMRPVEPFRERIHKKQAGPIYGGLAAWAHLRLKEDCRGIPGGARRDYRTVTRIAGSRFWRSPTRPAGTGRRHAATPPCTW